MLLLLRSCFLIEIESAYISHEKNENHHSNCNIHSLSFLFMASSYIQQPIGKFIFSSFTSVHVAKLYTFFETTKCF